jgi:hypothetical protein
MDCSDVEVQGTIWVGSAVMPTTSVPFEPVELALELVVLVHPAVSTAVAITAVPAMNIRSDEARLTFFKWSP